MSSLTLRINGTSHTLENVLPDMPLLWTIRDLVGLTGTKYGCGIGQCGACTVHLDGVAIRSCSTPASDAEGKEITTIEGLSSQGNHPVQQAWMETDVPQCGYCQTGQIMNAAAFLESNPNPTEEEINQAMAGNICRCGTYNRIREAIQLAAEKGGNS
jgi:isoquinoline 1-oxidoreductase alpha subunit